MIDRRPGLNTGAGDTPATGTGVPNNALAPDPRNQNSFSQSTIHDPGRPPPRAGPGGMRTSSPSSGISSCLTAGTRFTNESLDEPPPERAPATQPASAQSRVALGDLPSISQVRKNCTWLKAFVHEQKICKYLNDGLLSSLFYRFIRFCLNQI